MGNRRFLACMLILAVGALGALQLILLSKHVEEPSSLHWEEPKSLLRTQSIQSQLAQGKTKAPPGYLNTLLKNPLQSAVVQLEESCNEGASKDWDLEVFLQTSSKTKCSNRADLRTFACLAKCANEEPELEKTFRIMNIAKYNLHGLLRLCKREAFPYLVWIHKNEVLYAKCQRKPTGTTAFKHLMNLLQAVACSVEIPEVLFGFDANDYAIPQSESPLKFASEGWIHPLPGVIRLVGTEAHPCALFPTPPFLTSVGLADVLYNGLSDDVKLWESRTKPELAWEARKETIFWRGGSTGIPFDYDFIYFMPRPALGWRSGKLGGFDFAMTTSDGVSTKMIEQGFNEFVKQGELVSKKDFGTFKYHLHVDGNTASWGFAMKLLFESVVIWHKSPVTYREHYYALLKPWEHYIPLEPDMSNLEQVRDWLKTDVGREEATEIHKRVATLMKTRMRPEDALCYVLRLLYTEARLQNFVPHKELLRLEPEFGIGPSHFKPVR